MTRPAQSRVVVAVVERGRRVRADRVVLLCASLGLWLATAAGARAAVTRFGPPALRTAHAAAAAGASEPFPDDPGAGGPGDWRQTQGNLLPGAGIDAPQGWASLIAAGRPGAGGVTVAVLDSGVEAQPAGGLQPDFGAGRIMAGYDFVAGRRHVSDPSGHGSVVAGIIGEDTDNEQGWHGSSAADAPSIAYRQNAPMTSGAWAVIPASVLSPVRLAGCLSREILLGRCE